MDDMKLPEGKTCSDCRNWARCKKFIGSLTGKETTCDWAPSRFEESNESLMRQIEALQGKLKICKESWDEQKEQIRSLEHALSNANLYAGEYYTWVPYYENHLETLSMPVMIEADWMRQLIALEKKPLQKENERWNFLRPEVQWFAEQMEQALRDNDHKTGWKDEHQSWLLGELFRNAGKIFDSGYSLRRLVNTANFAMMIADNARGDK